MPPFDPDAFLAKYDTEFDPLEFMAKYDPEGLPSYTESALRGGAQGLTFGFADELTAAAEAPFSEKTYKELRDETRQKYRLAEEANPKTFIAGEMAGAIGPSIAATIGTGGAAAPGIAARLLAPTTVKGLAAAGGLYAAGKSQADLTQGELFPAVTDIAKGAAGGAVVGKVAPVLGNYAGKAARYAGEKMGETAEFLGSKAIGLTKGLRKKLDITPEKARSIGREAIESGVISPFADAEEMARRALTAKETIGQEIRQTVQEAEALGGSPNMTDLIAKLEERAEKYAGKEVTRGLYNQFKKVIKDLRSQSEMVDIPGGRAYQPGAVTPTKLQEYKEILGDVAWPEGVAAESKLGLRKSYTPIKEELEETVEQAVSPEKRQIYEYLKKRYGQQEAIETGLTERLAAEEGNRFVRPTDFLVGGAFGIGGGVIPGVASVLAKRGIEKYGHQVGAVTLDKMRQILERSPQLLGPYANVIKNAITRGSASFATTHYVLQQRDPEYRKLIDQLNEPD